jgi:ATP-dependent DNA ligase
MKAIAQSTGRTIAQIKTDANATGDLGIVAEQSHSNQCMIFQPASLTVQSVFSKLKDIAQMSGQSVSIYNRKFSVQGMFNKLKNNVQMFGQSVDINNTKLTQNRLVSGLWPSTGILNK